MGMVVYGDREVVCTAFLLKWLRLTLFLSSVHILPHEISVDAVCSFTSSPGWVLTCYETAALLCSGGRCSFRGWSNSCQHPACLINLLGLLQTKVTEECCVMWQTTRERYFMIYVELHLQHVSVTALRPHCTALVHRGILKQFCAFLGWSSSV